VVSFAIIVGERGKVSGVTFTVANHIKKDVPIGLTPKRATSRRSWVRGCHVATLPMGVFGANPIGTKKE
jgi:hypothetical protein